MFIMISMLKLHYNFNTLKAKKTLTLAFTVFTENQKVWLGM